MTAAETFQISTEQAEAYEAQLVPALFDEWAHRLVEAAGILPGQRALDVACGTGIVTRAAAEKVGTNGRAVGLDLNDAMLAVARRLRPDLEWRRGDATRLPFPDRSFEVVLCQSGLMFFPDVEGALREMARVVVADGRVALQVWDRRESQPAYAPFIQIAAHHAGPDAIELLSTYFVRGDLEELGSWCASAGLDITSVTTGESSLAFPSVDAFVTAEVQSTPLGERLSDEGLHRIIDDAKIELDRFRTATGVEIPIRGHLIVTTPAR